MPDQTGGMWKTNPTELAAHARVVKAALAGESGVGAWACGLCEHRSPQRGELWDHIAQAHEAAVRQAVAAPAPESRPVTRRLQDVADTLIRINTEGGNQLSFAELREANSHRCDVIFHGSGDEWSPTDWATAVAGEVGEACNLIKKMRRGEEIPLAEVGKELADSVIYLDLLARRLGLDLGEAVAQKFNEVSRRHGYTARQLQEG